jgi:16S rRNA (adenine1518-N6/adenine1519-N6)-dimethyltransferase
MTFSGSFDLARWSRARYSFWSVTVSLRGRYIPGAVIKLKVSNIVREPEGVRAMTSRRTRAAGQHMLVDNRVARRAAGFACLNGTDTVLEIGPGKGVLTRILAAGAGKVIAIEKDRKFEPFLREMPANVELVFADALKCEWPAFTKAVANLPYSISSPLTFRLLEKDFELAVLMYQKEFADRMVAAVGSPDYSRLSVEVLRRARCRILEEVPPGAFSPQPRVWSAIVELRPRPCPFEIRDGAIFSAVTRALFSHRRKSVLNALRSEEKLLGEMVGRLDGASPVARRRAESLSPEEIAGLANSLSP